MAPFFLLYYYQGPLQATLQALNLARAAMINSLIGAVVKTAVIFLLASQPSFGINGVAIGLLVGFVLVTLLHFATVLKTISFTFYIRDYVKTFLVMGFSGWFGYWFSAIFQSLLLQVLEFYLLRSHHIYLLYSFIIVRFLAKRRNNRIPWIGRPLSKLAIR